MKWKEFQEKYSEELYFKLKQTCDDYNSYLREEGKFLAFFCNVCYRANGSLCFPCSYIKEIYEEKHGVALDIVLNRK